MTQVWCGDELFFGGLIAVTGDSIATASPRDRDMPGFRDRLLAGESPSVVLGDGARIIPLDAVKRISTDRHDEDIDVVYAKGRKNETATLRLADPARRDEVYAALKRYFADKFNEFEESYSTPRAVFAPLMTATVLGFLTWLFAEAAREFQAGRADPNSQTETQKWIVAWALKLFGPVGVYIVGGILIALTLMTLVMRVKQPPTMLILQEGVFKPGTRIGLAFKYLLLLAMWGFVARVFWINL